MNGTITGPNIPIIFSQESFNNNNNNNCNSNNDNESDSYIPTVIGALGTVTKEFVQGLEDMKITGRWRLSKIQHC